MTVVGKGSVEIRPDTSRFESDLRAQLDRSLRSVRFPVQVTADTSKLDRLPAAAEQAARRANARISAEVDGPKLDASVVAAARKAAKKAADELSRVPGGVDAATFEAKVSAAAAAAAKKAAAQLANIPAGVDVSQMTNKAAAAAGQAASSAASRLDKIPVEVDISGVPRQVDRAMDAAERRVDVGAKRMASDARGALDGLGRTVATVAAGAGLTQVIFGGIEERREAGRLARQTEAVIRSTGGAARVSAGDVDRLTQSIRRKTQVDDDAVRGGANLLLTFTNVQNRVGQGNDVFNQATEVLVDLAAAMGTDVTGGAVQLGKALNDPVAGLTALTRVGVTFSQQQKDQIRSLVETGKVAEAQRIILAELRKEFGGSAAAQADELDRLTLKWDDLKERIGGTALTAIGFVNDIPGPAVAAGSALAGLSVGALVVSSVADAVSSLKGRLEGATIAGRSLSTVLGPAARVGLAAGIIASAAVAYDQLADALLRLQYGPAPKLSELSNQLVRFASDGKVAGELAREFGDDLGDLEQKVRSLNSGDRGTVRVGIVSGGNRIEDAKRDLEALDKSLTQLVETGERAAAANILEKLARGAGLSPEELARPLNDYRDALTKVDTSQRLAALSGSGLTDATGELGEGAADTALKIEAQERATARLAQALDRAYSSSQNLIGSQLGAADAIDRLRDSGAEVATRERELAEAIRLHGRASDEAKVAGEALADARRGQLGDIDTLAQASVRLAEQQASAAGRALTEADKYRIYRDKLIEIKDTIAPGSDLRRHLESLINGMPPPQIKSEVVIDTVKAEESLRRVREAAGLFKFNFGPFAGRMHSGGLVAGDREVPAILERGEYVVRRQVVEKVGTGALDRLNRGVVELDPHRRLPRFHEGGLVREPTVPDLSRLAGGPSVDELVRAFAATRRSEPVNQITRNVTVNTTIQAPTGDAERLAVLVSRRQGIDLDMDPLGGGD